MACNCITYECLDVDYDPCSNNIELPLEADETGDWAVQIEFNGTWIRLAIEVTDGENIVFPNVLNEHYVHTIRLLKSDKSLFNDICYKLKTMNVSASTIVPSGGTGSGYLETQAALYFTTGPATTTYQNDLLIGGEIISISVDGFPYTTFTFDNETGEINTAPLLPDGGTMEVIYKK